MFKWIKCLLGYHYYYFVRKLSDNSDVIACGNCNKLFAVNYPTGIILKYNTEIENFYDNFNKIRRDNNG